MFTKALAGVGILSLALIGGSPALAQNVRPDIALTTSSYGATTCAQFLHLAMRDRDGLVRRMVNSAPPSSLSTPVITADTNNPAAAAQLESEMNAPPLDAGQLVSACQAAPGNSTLRQAYAYQNSAPTPNQDVGF
jgi:hypothetical protein